MARILVIDDEPNVRKMIRLTLLKAGHDVGEAADGPSGLGEFGDGRRWDLTLVDERMPGMPGREVVREVRKRDPAARIVMITAFDTAELASEVVQAGATDFLRKPFTTETLRGAAAVALSRPRQAGPTMGVGPGAAGAQAEAPPPAVSAWLNGYRYWACDQPEVDEDRIPPGLEMRQSVRVTGPMGESLVCMVGLTPHVKQQVVEMLGREPAPDDPVWEVVGLAGLADFLWTKAQMPPGVLPLYELSVPQLESIQQMARQGD